MSNDAGGIGLFRSEFLYLESETYPTEDEQFKAYKMVAETMAGKKSLSVRLTSVQINRLIILTWIRKRIRRWDFGRSVSA